ncbi:Bile acid:sodium symporter (plasmid) [Haloterrigena turkmenica DSM 5511]|uniref:Bile acid:sodium symporter n=1 Tax=Haloterrigena turkmenica (strain ATCC 51198 / DSM 5511 / JCM 9101 / NCIMB 13204 / VKM B-1734 / 4k) TaxID=543526 RepID=D2S0Y9_HALTV|nr:sodium symporter [Haloterrigena turkmenica]ADB63036.1 Bile acid:sodium symporter [Haloterrigena turkmenica DSM 5511]
MGAATAGAVVDVGTAIFVLSTMLAMGLSLSVDQLLTAIDEPRLVSKSLVVNLAVVPIVAYVLVRAISVAPGYAVGILLIAVSPGAPFGPKFAELSNSNLAFANGLMAVLGVVSVVTIPATLALLLPGAVAVDPLSIGRLVFGIQLVPLVVGLGLESRYSSVADRLYPPVQRLSDASFVFLLVLLLLVYAGDMLTLLGTGTLFVSSVVVAASLLLGYVLGGPARDGREVLATTTAARNAAIALFIAMTSFSDPDVLTTVIAFSFVGVVGSALIAIIWGRRTSE